MRRFVSWLLAGLLLVRALEIRLPMMSRPLWEDEVHHSSYVLASRHVADMTRQMVGQFQPSFEYALRKMFWYPLMGVNERAMRLPALFFGCLTVVAAFFLASWFFRRRGMSSAWALFLAFCAGVWACDNATLAHYSAEARHYSFVALGSMLWASAFCLFEEIPVLAASALLFANLHFFSIPLIGAAYGWIAVRARGVVERAIPLVTAGAVIGVTVALNYPAFRGLVAKPPGAESVSFWTSLHEGIALWGDYGRDLALPAVPLVFWLGLALFKRENRSGGIRGLGLAAAMLPAFFIYLRSKSNYSFGSRYFLPFFGVGFAGLVLGLSVLRVRGLKGLTVVAALAWGFGLPQFARGLVTDRHAFHLPPANFSPYFAMHEDWKASGVPVFVLHSYCWSNDLSEYYLRFIGDDAPYRHGFWVRDSMGCEQPVATVREQLASFIEHNPKGLVVLDQKEADCAGTPCVWKVAAPRSIGEVASFAKGKGFKFGEGMF